MAEGRKTTKRAPLTAARITEAAFAVIERDGLEAFSTRRLAQELGCEAMSLYHYFPSKAHLMDALVEQHVTEFRLPPADAPWRERLAGLVSEWRRLAMARPEFFRYFGLHRLNTPGGLRLLDWMLKIFSDAGFAPEMATRLFRLTGYYVIGGLLDETSGYARGPSAVNPPDDETIARDYPRVAAAAPFFRTGSFEPTFDLGFEILVDAFERFLREEGAADTKGNAT